MEVLETKGVPVIGFQTQMMPSFFSSSSTYRTDGMANNAEEIAHILNVHWQLDHAGGVIIANPVPARDAMEHELIEALIADAIVEAKHRGIRHKEVTPFLLSIIAEKSGQQSLKANVSLVENNAYLAAAIAHEFTKVERHI
jgi:pseudouridine-5'-phosphate glycosidase